MAEHRHSQQVNLSLPEELWRRMEGMVTTREMTLNALVSELVILGMNSLQYPEHDPMITVKGIDPSDDGFSRS